MKTSILPILVVCGLLFACEAAQQPVTVELSSGSDLPLVEAPVVLSRGDLNELLGQLPGQAWVQLSVEGKPIPHQYDDWNADGQWDEVFFLLDFPTRAQTLEVELLKGKPVFDLALRTQLHLGKVVVKDSIYEAIDAGNRVMGTETATTIAVYQFEGPGWENDHIAFRTYFDERNGIDIFGKQTTDMVLQKVGTGQNYHELRDWGMDILKVANSLGAGALALSYQDSLYRVTDDSTSTVRLLVEGPLRSGLAYFFPSVEVGDTVVSVTHQISIVAGAHGYQSSVTVSPVLPGMTLVSGIVNLHSDSCYLFEAGDMAMIYTHDHQAFDGEYLGLAIMANQADYLGQLTCPEEGPGITQTYGMEMSLRPDAATQFWFLAGWEIEDEKYASRDSFLQMLVSEANKQRLEQ